MSTHKIYIYFFCGEIFKEKSEKCEYFSAANKVPFLELI